VVEGVSAAKPVAGWEVDHAVRDYIKNAGFERYFIHRTGHSIGTESMPTAPTWMTWRFMTSVASWPTHVFRSSRHLPAGIRSAQRSKHADQAQCGAGNR